MCLGQVTQPLWAPVSAFRGKEVPGEPCLETMASYFYIWKLTARSHHGADFDLEETITKMAYLSLQMQSS